MASALAFTVGRARICLGPALCTKCDSGFTIWRRSLEGGMGTLRTEKCQWERIPEGVVWGRGSALKDWTRASILSEWVCKVDARV